MPDPQTILQAAVAAGILAAVTLLTAWPTRRRRCHWTGAAAALGIGVGTLVGAWLLGLAPNFPPREDQDRLLLFVIPGVVLTEIVAAFFRLSHWPRTFLRLAVAGGVAPTLLYGSVYLSRSTAPGSGAWSTIEIAGVLSALGLALAANWFLLLRLARRGAVRSVPLVLALACAGAGVAVMLSGYASGGQLAFPLVAGLTGVVIASLFFGAAVELESAVGIGAVALLGILMLGRYFGNLTTSSFALLFSAPLLAWLPEVPPVRRLGMGFQAVSRIALSAVPIGMVVAFAVQKFNADSRRPGADPAANQSSVDDYLNFGK